LADIAVDDVLKQGIEAEFLSESVDSEAIERRILGAEIKRGVNGGTAGH
jgi:hypothetical protein